MFSFHQRKRLSFVALILLIFALGIGDAGAVEILGVQCGADVSFAKLVTHFIRGIVLSVVGLIGALIVAAIVFSSSFSGGRSGNTGTSSDFGGELLQFAFSIVLVGVGLVVCGIAGIWGVSSGCNANSTALPASRNEDLIVVFATISGAVGLVAFLSAFFRRSKSSERWAGWGLILLIPFLVTECRQHDRVVFSSTEKCQEIRTVAQNAAPRSSDWRNRVARRDREFCGFDLVPTEEDPMLRCCRWSDWPEVWPEPPEDHSIESLGSPKVPTILPDFSLGAGQCKSGYPSDRRGTMWCDSEIAIDKDALRRMSSDEAFGYLKRLQRIPKIVPTYEWCSLQKSAVNIPNDGPVPYGALSVVIGKPGSSFRGQEITISVFRETRKEQYHAINTPTCLIAVFRWENDSNEKLAVGAVQSLLRLGLPVRPYSGIWLCVAKARLVDGSFQDRECSN